MRLYFAAWIALLALLLGGCKPPQKMSAPGGDEPSAATTVIADSPSDLDASDASSPVPVPVSTSQPTAPPAPKKKPDSPRSDEKLLVKYRGKSMAEILADLGVTGEPSIDDFGEKNQTATAPEKAIAESSESAVFTVVPVEWKLSAGNAIAIAVADFDGDAHLDVVSQDGENGRVRLFTQSAKQVGKFTESSQSALDTVAGGHLVQSVDFDADRNIDLMILRGEGLPSSLLRNTGSGRFEDVTSEVGLLDFRDSRSAGWADFDGDGNLDLLLVNRGNEDVRCGLYLADGEGKFVERSHAWGLNGGAQTVIGVALLDVDCDGWLDVALTSGDEQRKGLPLAGWWRNISGGRFQRYELPGEIGVGPLRVADFDEDGREDLLAFDGQLWRWWRNTTGSGKQGAAEFVDLTEFADLTSTRLNSTSGERLTISDFDGDGSLDLLGGQPLQLLLNRGGDRFIDVEKTAIGDALGKISVGSEWLVTGDFDNDGDVDVLAADQLLLGRASETQAALRWRLSPELAGALLTVTVRDAAWVQMSVHRRIGPTGDIDRPIGLGEADAVVGVEFRRPGETAASAVHVLPRLGEVLKIELPDRRAEGSTGSETGKSSQ